MCTKVIIMCNKMKLLFGTSGAFLSVLSVGQVTTFIILISAWWPCVNPSIALYNLNTTSHITGAESTIKWHQLEIHERTAAQHLSECTVTLHHWTWVFLRALLQPWLDWGPLSVSLLHHGSTVARLVLFQTLKCTDTVIRTSQSTEKSLCVTLSWVEMVARCPQSL